MPRIRLGRPIVCLSCPVCHNGYAKEAADYARNVRLGRANVCSRKCLAVHMNKSPAKLAKTRAQMAKRNAAQWREANPNWKGGLSPGLKPLPVTPAEGFPPTGTSRTQSPAEGSAPSDASTTEPPGDSPCPPATS